MDGKQWAEKIIQVQSGLLTATEAARQLGVSRKTYYKRENRALAGLMGAVQDRDGGRPERKEDAEKEALKKRVAELENETLVLRQTLHIREVLGAPPGNPVRRKGPEKAGVSEEGRALDRPACGQIEGVFPEQAGAEAGKPADAVEETPAKEAAGNEYGLEKKRARQDE